MPTAFGMEARAMPHNILPVTPYIIHYTRIINVKPTDLARECSVFQQ